MAQLFATNYCYIPSTGRWFYYLGEEWIEHPGCADLIKLRKYQRVSLHPIVHPNHRIWPLPDGRMLDQDTGKTIEVSKEDMILWEVKLDYWELIADSMEASQKIKIGGMSGVLSDLLVGGQPMAVRLIVMLIDSTRAPHRRLYNLWGGSGMAIVYAALAIVLDSSLEGQTPFRWWTAAQAKQVYHPDDIKPRWPAWQYRTHVLTSDMDPDGLIRRQLIEDNQRVILFSNGAIDHPDCINFRFNDTALSHAEQIDRTIRLLEAAWDVMIYTPADSIPK